MWRKWWLVIFLQALSMVAQAQNVVVLASIEPLAQVLRELYQEQPHIEVQTLLLPQQNPHHASLTPGQARRVLTSHMVVWLGEEAEPHIASVVNQHAKTQVPLSELPNVMRLQEVEAAGEGHLDPHLWLAPQNIRVLVKALGEHVGTLQLDDAAWQQAQGIFLTQLTVAEEQVKKRLAPYSAATYLSHHDAWGYFAESFQLRRPLVVATQIDGEASSRRVVALRKAMKEEQVRCVMAEPEARKGLLRRLCDEGCVLYEVDPLGRAQQGPYTAFLRYLGEQFAACFAGEPQH